MELASSMHNFDTPVHSLFQASFISDQLSQSINIEINKVPNEVLFPILKGVCH